VVKKTKKRITLQQAQERAEVARLFLCGHSQAEIAKMVFGELDYNAANVRVTRHLKAIRKDWRETALTDWSALRDRQLAKLAALQKEAWDAWERSCQGKTSTKDVRILARKLRARLGRGRNGQNVDLHSAEGPDEGSESSPEEMTPVQERHEQSVTSSPGDVRFLELIRACIAEENKLLGLLTEKGEELVDPPVIAFQVVLPSGEVIDDPDFSPDRMVDALKDDGSNPSAADVVDGGRFNGHESSDAG
jgi:hypothetical protein